MATSKRTKSLNIGDRVRAKTTGRVGEVTNVTIHDSREHLTVSYDHQPQDEYLTTPARSGVDLPRELLDRAT
jgi:hypothetical protein